MIKRTPKVFRIVTPNVVYPQDHEMATARILAKTGDVEFLIPSRTAGAHTPDITWQSLDWEMKSPFGKSLRKVQDLLKRALKQSRNIIFDGRNSKLSDEIIVKELQRQVKLTRGIKRLIFITKEGEIVDIK